jgi:hypothetical protein
MNKRLLSLVLMVLVSSCSKKSGSQASAKGANAAGSSAAGSAATAAAPATTCKDVADCEAQCAKDPAACGQEGWFKLKANDGKGAIPLLQKACDTGLGAYCFSEGLALLNGQGGLKKDEATAQSLFEKGCSLKIAKACGQASVTYFDGPKKDSKKGISFETQACMLGFIPACSQGATDLVRAKDHKGAGPLAKVGCEAKDALSCAYYGGFLEEEKQFDAAKAAYTTACAGGYKDACGWKDDVGKPHTVQASAGTGGNDTGGDTASNDPAPAAEDPKVTNCKAQGEHYAMCDDDCVDLSSSHDNCGACKASCRSDESCEESTSFGIKCKEPDGTYDDPQ